MVSSSQILFAALTLLYGTSTALANTTPAAQSCHNPDALGTSRTISVGGAPELGLKTYPQTLDLQDHEVVLTFDDGPWGPTTPSVLKALDEQCVKATFFLIGRNAQAHPDLVKREIADGHTVGHHTWDHPAVTLRNLQDKAALLDITHGMEADDKAAGYGPWTGEPHVPFFRFPGFGDSAVTKAYLQKHRIAVFGADLWASDWIPMTPEVELDRLMGRLHAAGRGIILLHDIKKQTADMLPRFLAELKAENYHVVAMIPGGTSTPIRSAPAGWTSETEAAVARIRPKSRPAIVPASATNLMGSSVPTDEPLPLRGTDGQ